MLIEPSRNDLWQKVQYLLDPNNEEISNFADLSKNFKINLEVIFSNNTAQGTDGNFNDMFIHSDTSINIMVEQSGNINLLGNVIIPSTEHLQVNSDASFTSQLDVSYLHITGSIKPGIQGLIIDNLMENSSYPQYILSYDNNGRVKKDNNLITLLNDVSSNLTNYSLTTDISNIYLKRDDAKIEDYASKNEVSNNYLKIVDASFQYYAEINDVSNNYLKKLDASNTYLKIVDASFEHYITIIDTCNNYLKIIDASNTYLKIVDASFEHYALINDVSNNYLNIIQADASFQQYALFNDVNSNYLKKNDASNIYLKIQDASFQLYALINEVSNNYLKIIDASFQYYITNHDASSNYLKIGEASNTYLKILDASFQHYALINDVYNKTYIDNSLSNVYTKTEANREIRDLFFALIINGAPFKLNSLQELANAIGNDPNFSNTIDSRLDSIDSSFNNYVTKEYFDENVPADISDSLNEINEKISLIDNSFSNYVTQDQLDYFNNLDNSVNVLNNRIGVIEETLSTISLEELTVTASELINPDNYVSIIPVGINTSFYENLLNNDQFPILSDISINVFDSSFVSGHEVSYDGTNQTFDMSYILSTTLYEEISSNTLDITELGNYSIEYKGYKPIEILDISKNNERLIYNGITTISLEILRTRNVQVVNKTPPTITLVGEIVISNHEVFTVFTDLGASAEDVFGVNITSNIDISNTIDISTVGTYTIIYDVSDSYGNFSSTTRTVKVVDTSPPTIIYGLTDLSFELNQDITDFSFLQDISAFDAYDYSKGLTVSISFETIDITSVGTISMEYIAIDSNDNSFTALRTVRVVDTTPPIITGAIDLIYAFNTSINNALLVENVSATDNANGDITSLINVTHSITNSIPGTYIVSYSVSDTAGNQATETINLTILPWQPQTNQKLKSAVDEWCDDNSHNIALANYGHISSWDTSLITDMSYLFYFKFDSVSNEDLNISNWDVSNVRNMESMFEQCHNFNQPLHNWNVGNVTNMTKMFYHANSFNQDISNWNVENVTTITYMFGQAALFNQPLNDWNVSNVTSMEHLFETNNGSLFNQPLDKWGDKLGKVTTMKNMFANCINFNQNISNWDVSNVSNMYGMFSVAGNLVGTPQDPVSVFNQPLNDWNVSNVENMSHMFQNCENFNQPLNDWNVGKVTTMKYMFRLNRFFNQPLDNWAVGNVTNMENMFEHAQAFNQNLSSWNVSSVTSFSNMFNGANALSNENKLAIDATFSTNNTWPYDWTPPFVDISTNKTINGTVNNFTSITFIFTISEPVSTFDISDISFNNGILSNFTTNSSTNYSVNFAPLADGSCSLQVLAGVFEDNDENLNSESNIAYTWYHDSSIPEISLNGLSNIIHEVLTPYNDPGATATDSYDGDLTNSINVGGNLDISTVGIYTITYDVSDSAGNEATVTRTIEVKDTTPPTIIYGLTDLSFELNQDITDFSFLADVTASDSYDNYKGLTVSISYETIYTTSIGTISMEYTATDSCNNSFTAIRTVYIVDSTSPTVEISSNNITPDSTNDISNIRFIFTISEPVTTFDINDISFNNGNLSNFNGSGTTYTVDFEPIANGSCSIEVSAGAFVDSAGNSNIASDIFSWTYNTEPAITYTYNINLLQEIVGTNSSDGFAYDVAISPNGNRIAIGSTRREGRKGETIIYEYNDVSWVQLGDTIVGEIDNEQSGESLVFNETGNIIVISSPFLQDRVRIYKYIDDSNSWNKLGEDLTGSSGDEFGRALAINYQGNRIAIGAAYDDINNIVRAGSVSVYDYNDVSNSWVLNHRFEGINERDFLGNLNLSLDACGNRIAIGRAWADTNGKVDNGELKIYDYNDNLWNLIGNFEGTDGNQNFGLGFVLSRNGQRIAITSIPWTNSFDSHINIYEYDNVNTWNQIGIINKEDDGIVDNTFALRPDMNYDGNRIVFSRPYWNHPAGKIYLYEYNDSSWNKIFDESGNSNIGHGLGHRMSLSADGKLFITSAYSGGGFTPGKLGYVHIYEIEKLWQPQSNQELKNAVDEWCDPNSYNLALDNYGHISTWNTSLITDMSGLFQDKTSFNDDIGNWDVSNVTIMADMFNGATSFNQNISSWDVTNVTNFTDMFLNANALSNENKLAIDASFTIQNSNWNYDLTPPFVDISTNSIVKLPIEINGTTNNVTPITFIFTISEPVSTFDISDIYITNGILSDFDGSGTTYTVDFAPLADGSCSLQVLADTFADSAGNSNSASDVFSWTYNKIPELTYHPEIDGGGWILVRRVQKGLKWHPFNDNLGVTGQDISAYGWVDNPTNPVNIDYYTNPDIDICDNLTFSRDFETACPGFDQFLFWSGTWWLVANKTSVYDNSFYSNNPRQIELSSISGEPYTARWYFRGVHLGLGEDPWISVNDHFSNPPMIVYGENDIALYNNNLQIYGANVYVRKV